MKWSTGHDGQDEVALREQLRAALQQYRAAEDALHVFQQRQVLGSWTAEDADRARHMMQEVSRYRREFDRLSQAFTRLHTAA